MKVNVCARVCVHVEARGPTWLLFNRCCPFLILFKTEFSLSLYLPSRLSWHAFELWPPWIHMPLPSPALGLQEYAVPEVFYIRLGIPNLCSHAYKLLTTELPFHTCKLLANEDLLNLIF